MTILRIMFSIFAIVVGAFALFGVWLPSLRGIWGGGIGGTPKEARDRVRLGAVSCAGFGFLFISGGLIAFCLDMIPKSLASLLLACMLASFFLVIAGWLFDSRAHGASRRVYYRLPGEPRIGTPEERQRWGVAACGFLFLIIVILVMILHR
jgi:hypothetical protein